MGESTPPPEIKERHGASQLAGQLRAFLTTHGYSIAHLRYGPLDAAFESGMGWETLCVDGIGK